MTSDRYCLKWNNFQTNIVQALGNLKVDEDFVDVTLSVEGKSIKAHKVILSACSDYFREIFKDNPCTHPVIILRDAHYGDVEGLVRYIYRGEVDVSQERLHGFLRTAEMLRIKGLADQDLAESSGDAVRKTSGDYDAIKSEESLSSPPSHYTSLTGSPPMSSTSLITNHAQHINSRIQISNEVASLPRAPPIKVPVPPTSSTNLLKRSSFTNLAHYLSGSSSMTQVNSSTHQISTVLEPNLETTSASVKRRKTTPRKHDQPIVHSKQSTSPPVHYSGSTSSVTASPASPPHSHSTEGSIEDIDRDGARSSDLIMDSASQTQQHQPFSIPTLVRPVPSYKSPPFLRDTQNIAPQLMISRSPGAIKGENLDDDEEERPLVIEEDAGSKPDTDLLLKNRLNNNKDHLVMLASDQTLDLSNKKNSSQASQQHIVSTPNSDILVQGLSVKTSQASGIEAMITSHHVQPQESQDLSRSSSSIQQLQQKQKHQQQQQQQQLPLGTLAAAAAAVTAAAAAAASTSPAPPTSATPLRRASNAGSSSSTSSSTSSTSVAPVKQQVSKNLNGGKEIAQAKSNHNNNNNNNNTSMKSTGDHPRNRWRCMQPRNCPYCFKTFSNSFNLKQHTINVHIESQGVSCNICEKVVKNKWYLRKHLVTAHGAPLKRAKDGTAKNANKRSTSLRVENDNEDDDEEEIVVDDDDGASKAKAVKMKATQK